MNKLRVCLADQVADLLPGGLAGDYVLAPVADLSSSQTQKLLASPTVDEISSGVLICTSGSTGHPKEVLLSTKALQAAAKANQQYFGATGTWHLALPAHYVAGMMVFVRAFFAGTKVQFTSTSLENLEPVSGPNFISIVPTQLARALKTPEIVKNLAKFEAILLGGGPVSPTLVEQAQDAKLNVTQTYGMSETCGGIVYDASPLPGVKIGLTSENVVKLTTPTAFSGYRNNPKLTAEVLDENTVLTSDLGQITSDGRLVLTGRTDDIIKCGGLKVNLAHIQQAVDEVISSQKKVDLARTCVVWLPDNEWSQIPVLVTESKQTIDWWREKLSEKIDRTSLPKKIVQVNEVKLTSTGKLDRQANQELAEKSHN